MSYQFQKTCDLPGRIAAELLVLLNPGMAFIREFPYSSRDFEIVTKNHPEKLVFPEGWYFAKGTFRNKHYMTTGAYSEVSMVDQAGNPWSGSVIPDEAYNAPTTITK